jgi:intracellular sulfur oxidation DsrE/DsrF family protein
MKLSERWIDRPNRMSPSSYADSFRESLKHAVIVVLMCVSAANCGGSNNGKTVDAAPTTTAGSLFNAAAASSDNVAAAAVVPTCPQAAVDTMNIDFGPGTGDITKCLAVRENIRVAVNLSTSTLNPNSGISQTINNVKNLVQNYEGIYGLTLDDEYKIVVVAHFAGARFLLNDDAYNRTYAVTTGNPSRTDVEALVAKGIPVYMCQNTMRSNHWVTANLIPGVREVPGGVAALVDYSLQHWALLTP